MNPERRADDHSSFLTPHSSPFALIPAGGRSTRMGRPKLSLPLGACSVLERVVATFRQAGVEHVLVVVGAHVPELAPLAEQAGALVHVLAEPTDDMRATVVEGLAWLDERFHPREDDCWLLAPADHPALDVEAVRSLLAAARAEPDRIVIPTHGGKRGHPAAIPWRWAAAIRGLPAGEGLNHYFRAHSELIRELPVASADILSDLDTPEDYRRFQQRQK